MKKLTSIITLLSFIGSIALILGSSIKGRTDGIIIGLIIMIACENDLRQDGKWLK